LTSRSHATADEAGLSFAVRKLVWGPWECQSRENSDRRVPWEAPAVAVA
jgi:hypothetical protein